MVVFDLDGTLIADRSSWGRVHEFFGTEHKGNVGLAKYERGEMNYEQFMRHDMSAWPAGISLDVFRRIFAEYRLNNGAKECIEGLKKRGIRTGVITSGIDVLGEMVCRELAIDSFVGNGLEFDEAGRLTGGVIPRVDLYRKDDILVRMAKEQGFITDEVLGVGDTRFDSSFLRACRYRVALNPREVDRKALREVVHCFIDDLRELLPIVDSIASSGRGLGSEENQHPRRNGRQV